MNGYQTDRGREGESNIMLPQRIVQENVFCGSVCHKESRISMHAGYYPIVDYNIGKGEE